jgi:hypothetical protein
MPISHFVMRWQCLEFSWRYSNVCIIYDCKSGSCMNSPCPICKQRSYWNQLWMSIVHMGQIGDPGIRNINVPNPWAPLFIFLSDNSSSNRLDCYTKRLHIKPAALTRRPGLTKALQISYRMWKFVGYDAVKRGGANVASVSEVWEIIGFHGGDYEKCRMLEYKNPVDTAQETHYVSATEHSQLMLCKISGFHGGDYEKCRMLRYKNPVRTSQETH